MAQACLGIFMVCQMIAADPAPADDAQVAEAEQPPAETCGLPICGPLGQLAFCVEGYESHHNGAAVNGSSGASGWLQYLPSTARRWGVAIGNRQSEWDGFARIAAVGRGFLVSQWVPLQRGLC